jgi:hypothetical protein
MKIWRSEDVAWRRIGPETVVVHLTRHRMCALNEAGGRIWEELATPLAGEQLSPLLNEPAATAFLTDLVDEGLVESDGPIPASPQTLTTESNIGAPRIEWREEVRRFAQGCSFYPFGSEICFQNPSTS